MASRKSKAPPPLPGPGKKPAKKQVRKFQAQAGRIIAESGGLTAECQVKLMALGKTLGLPEEEVLEAVGSLETAPETRGEVSVEQAREEFFEQYLQGRLAEKQGGLLLPGEEKQLVAEGGEAPFALARSVAKRIVRQVARQNRLSLMSPHAARLHVARLVRDLMGDSPTLCPHARKRIDEEAANFGLTPGQLHSIIRKQEKENRRDEVVNRSAVAIAVFAVLAVAALFVLLLLPRRPAPEPPVAEEVLIEQPAGGGGDWWDADLVVAIGKARTMLRRLQPILKQIESPDSEVRGTAYEALIAGLAAGEDEPSDREVSDAESPSAAEQEEWLVTVLEAEPPSPASDRAVRGSPHPAPTAARSADLRPAQAGLVGESFSEGLEDEPPATILENEAKSGVLKDVLVGCYALDPSDTSAERLRTALLALVPGPEGELPEGVLSQQVAFWAIETAVAALEHPQLDTPRAEALASAIGKSLHVEVDRRLMPKEQIEHCLGALCARLYERLIATAGSQPDRAQDDLRELADRAERYLDSYTLDRLNLDLLAAVLPAAPEAWTQYRSLIRRSVNSQSPERLLKLVDLLEHSGNRDLQRYLAGLFLDRFGIDSRVSSLADLAAEVRKRIDEATTSRAERFRRCAARILEDTLAPGYDPESLLRTTVSLTKVSTLGCALAQGDAGETTFDTLVEELEAGQPASLAAPAPDSRRSSAERRRPPIWVADCIRKLRGSSPQASGVRVSSLERLADAADRNWDLTPQQGALVARYLLTAKNRTEHEEMLPYCHRIGRWEFVRLGLADVLADVRYGVSPLQQERVLEVVSEVLGTEIAPGEDESWRQTRKHLSRTLLRHVYDTLLDPANRPGQDHQADEQIRKLYGTQAKLLGIPPDEYLAATTPAELLRQMILHHAGRLAPRSLRPADNQYLDDLPHELAAAEYLGENDLARTVLFQRIWARLLAIGAVEQNTNQAARVEKLLRRLRESDRDATHIAAQLHEGERAVVRLWMALVVPTSLESNPKASSSP